MTRAGEREWDPGSGIPPGDLPLTRTSEAPHELFVLQETPCTHFTTESR